MANYRDIKGFQIQSLDSDPVPYVGSWASGPNVNQGRKQGFAVGTQTAAFWNYNSGTNSWWLCTGWKPCLCKRCF